MTNEISEDFDFFPMICEECGESFGKDVIKLALHSATHYPDRGSDQQPTRFSDSKKQKPNDFAMYQN
ncbi:MAG TPA: hypothetical protein VD731_01780 [Nitrosopumilaceae archaeon]|nr:hypothetical protein [Nitrosopumilaceae archaeon]